MNNKKENTKYFKERINFYMKYFQLAHWRWEVCPMDVKYTKDSIAHTKTLRSRYQNNQGCNQLVWFEYSENWISYTNKTKIDSVAFHEVWELILIKLRTWSTLKEHTPEHRELDDEVHGIIRRMENIILPVIKNKTV